MRLNYQHLFYFHVVARSGSLKRAAIELGLSHSTLSTQVRALEAALGAALFDRAGRSLELTDDGRVVRRYTEEIFDLGTELVAEVRGRAMTGTRLRVGLVDAVPRVIVRRLLEAVLAMSPPPRIVCRGDHFDRLLTALTVHGVDVIIADAPVPPGLGVAAFSHLLGTCGVTFLASRQLAHRLMSGPPARSFPACLHRAPLLLPPATTVLRRSLDPWFQRHDVQPRGVAEIEDMALAKSLGAGGVGVFVAPRVVEAEICMQYGVVMVGRTDEIKERFFAISTERRIKNPATLALTRARLDLFV